MFHWFRLCNSNSSINCNLILHKAGNMTWVRNYIEQSVTLYSNILKLVYFFYFQYCSKMFVLTVLFMRLVNVVDKHLFCMWFRTFIYSDWQHCTRGSGGVVTKCELLDTINYCLCVYTGCSCSNVFSGPNIQDVYKTPCHGALDVMNASETRSFHFHLQFGDRTIMKAEGLHLANK